MKATRRSPTWNGTNRRPKPMVYEAILRASEPGRGGSLRRALCERQKVHMHSRAEW
jgi:hypothetical protein